MQAFEDSRKTDLQNFQTQYDSLKTQYSTAIYAAIQETDTASQNNLIQQVLAINQNLTDSIRGIITQLSQGTDQIDTATLESLTTDLIKYQQDYQNLKTSIDKLQTLKMIQATATKKLDAAIWAYNIYLSALTILCLVIIMLAIRASWTTNVVKQVTGGFKTLVGGR
jgi:DNA repair exonuclease SbcCD ATPase subunit